MTNKLISSISVLFSTIESISDVIRPRVFLRKPSKVVFDMGTHLDGAPHIGTYLVITLAFLLAEQAEEKLKIPAEIKLTALDNAPYETPSRSGSAFYKNYGYVLNQVDLEKLINDYYLNYLEYLEGKTGIKFTLTSYRKQQSEPNYRRAFFEMLSNRKLISHIISPKDNKLNIRTECPVCGLVEKDSTSLKLKSINKNLIIVSSICPSHGEYVMNLTKAGVEYLDTTSLLRNLVKETVYFYQKETLGVMVKGEDWIHGSQLVDLAHAVLGRTALDVPARIFTPKITFSNGDKISKTIIRNHPEAARNVNRVLINLSDWINSDQELKDGIYKFGKTLLSNPNHFYRSYAHQEVEKFLGL